MSDAVQCRFSYTQAEAELAQSQLRQHNDAGAARILRMSQAVLAMSVLSLLIGTGVVGFLRLIDGGTIGGTMVPWSLSAWPAFAAFLILQLILARKGESAALRIPDHPEQTAQVSNAGIVLSNEFCESHYKWSAYESAILEDGTILLQDRTRTFLALPARGFASTEERERAWLLISAKVPPSASRR